MKNSQKIQNNPWIILSFFIGVIIGAALYQILEEPKIIYEDKIIYQEKEQPMLLLEFDGWGENINDSSEIIFRYFIYNFGDVEAKNVKVICEISDVNDNIIKTAFFNIGNIASNSHEYQESYLNYYGNSMEKWAICDLENTDGDYINLLDKLSDIE